MGESLRSISFTSMRESTSGSSMLSFRLKLSSRLKSWNTKPRCSRLKRALSLSLTRLKLCPSSNTSPQVGLSSVANMFSRVVLPLPLGPIMATNSPSCTSKETPFSALNWRIPLPVLYTLVIFDTFNSSIFIPPFVMHLFYRITKPICHSVSLQMGRVILQFCHLYISLSQSGK